MTRDPDDSVLQQIIEDRRQDRVDWQISREERLVENYPEQWRGAREP